MIKIWQTLGRIEMGKRTLKAVVVATALAFGGLYSAKAVPTVMLSSDGGLNWTTVVSTTPGSLLYSGFVGTWSVNVSGSTLLSPAELNLLDVTAITRNAGSLTVRFFETDLTLDSINGFFKNQAAGTVANRGSLSMNTYIDTSNGGFSTIPGTAVQLTGQTFFGAFDEMANSAYSPLPTAPFSLMVEATIMLRGSGGMTYFSQSLVDPPPNSVPDGGSALALLGSALAGLGFFSRSRKVG